jgi:3-mercaptopyruvate sulfurtransferase SseA
MPKRNQIPIFLIMGGGLLLIVAAILLATQKAPAAPTPVVSFGEDTFPDIPRVSLADAKAGLDAGSAIFVDVRSARAYQAGHITGALSIPLEEMESRLGELDKTEWIVTYCT